MLKKFIKLIVLTVLEEVDLYKEIKRLEAIIEGQQKTVKAMNKNANKWQIERNAYRAALIKKVGSQNIKALMLKEAITDSEDGNA
jgi:hypothetical protein